MLRVSLVGVCFGLCVAACGGEPAQGGERSEGDRLAEPSADAGGYVVRTPAPPMYVDDAAAAPVVACTSNADCDAIELCDTPEGQCGAEGVCAPRGVAYDCIMTERPVCGCDGATYLNACVAAKAGVAIDFEGACGDAGGSD